MKGKIVVALLALGAAPACERIPGTDAYKTKIGKERASAVLSDPASAQFRNLSIRLRVTRFPTRRIRLNLLGRKHRGVNPGAIRLL